MTTLISAVLTAVPVAVLLTMATGAGAGDPAGWRERTALMARNLALPLWRLLAVLPPGRAHERHARAELGMAARHPERCTRPGTAREHRLLGQIQVRTWPEDEWVDVIRYRDGAP